MTPFICGFYCELQNCYPQSHVRLKEKNVGPTRTHTELVFGLTGDMAANISCCIARSELVELKAVGRSASTKAIQLKRLNHSAKKKNPTILSVIHFYKR